MPAFLPGLQLNAAFYHEVVGPLLAREFPGLVYSAALIGYGSDVLGFDTERSTDHGWGPRLWLFLRADGKFADQAAAILAMLRAQLPLTFHGYPTNYARSEGDGVPVMAATDTPPINHEVIVTWARFRHATGYSRRCRNCSN